MLAAVLGGAVMAVPSIGQGPAVVPPLVLALIASGPNEPFGIAAIVGAWLLCATQLAPRLTAGVLHLSGTTVFLAGSAGGLVAGPIGAIFALPIVAAIEEGRVAQANEELATGAVGMLRTGHGDHPALDHRRVGGEQVAVEIADAMMAFDAEVELL